MQSQQYNQQSCDKRAAEIDTLPVATSLLDQVLIQFAIIASLESNAHVVNDHILRDIGLQRTVARHI